MNAPNKRPDKIPILDVVTCYCSRYRENGICDCIDARTRAAELEAIFDLRWKADMRAIKLWQDAHPGQELTWPDHTDLVVWFMELFDGAGVQSGLPAGDPVPDRDRGDGPPETA